MESEIVRENIIRTSIKKLVRAINIMKEKNKK